MFADKPEDFIKGAHIEVISDLMNNTDRMSSEVFDGPIWIQARYVTKYFQDAIMRSYTLRSSDVEGNRVIYNYPAVAFEELATNLILHRQYDHHSYGGIYVYSDKIVFVNHNRPLPPLTIRDLNERTEFPDRQYLNPELKEKFLDLNLIESFGSGIRRAKTALEQNSSPSLLFEPDNDVDDHTMVTMYINPEFAKLKAEEDGVIVEEALLEPINDRINDRIKLSQDAKVVLAILLSEPYSTQSEIARKTGFSESKIRRIVREMRENNIIQRIGSNKTGYWIIKED